MPPGGAVSCRPTSHPIFHPNEKTGRGGFLPPNFSPNISPKRKNRKGRFPAAQHFPQSRTSAPHFHRRIPSFHRPALFLIFFPIFILTKIGISANLKTMKSSTDFTMKFSFRKKRGSRGAKLQRRTEKLKSGMELLEILKRF